MLDDGALPDLAPLAGGWSGETFVAEAGGERQVVRIYARDPLRAEVDAALMRLVRGLVPVPRVLELRPPGPDVPSLLVTSWVDGVRGDLLLPTLDDAGSARLGAEVGALAARLAGMPQPGSGGFAGADLRIEPWDDLDGLPGHIDQHRPALAHWSADERAGLAEVAAVAQERLDAVGRLTLVHGDLNPKNWLADPVTLRVTALLDWEYAHAGHPFTDLGNTLRFDRRPAWVEAVAGAWCERHRVAPDDALRLARDADLWALVDLAARRGQNPVADAAHDLLRGIGRTRDAGWTPSPGRA